MTMNYNTISHHSLPSEHHAADDDWNDFEVVNDPASGKKIPNEGHAVEDDWDDFEAVNDPASGKKIPNEGHATQWMGYERSAMPMLEPTPSIIYVTERFWRDIESIYGNFTAQDPEYPALGITIQGAPIFVECIRYPEEAVVRRQASDEVRGDHPTVEALWERILNNHQGKCRKSTVHIHPMNLPALSGTDVRNFESLRTNPHDPSTFGVNQPYPVILVNLTATRKLELLGFWINQGVAYRTRIKPVADDAPQVTEAWSHAQPLPFFSEEAAVVRHINRQLTGRRWTVELGVNPRTQVKAIKAQAADGRRVLLRFTPGAPLGLSFGDSTSLGLDLEAYVDWVRLFDDLAQASHQPDIRGQFSRLGQAGNSNNACKPITPLGPLPALSGATLSGSTAIPLESELAYTMP